MLTLVGVVWRMHENHDRERNEVLWDQIGRDSEHGMRKIVHDSANRLSEVVPVSRELERRMEKLERKVFNGHRREDE
jgi:hypothetical protein